MIDSNHTCVVYGVTEEIEAIMQCPKEEKLFLSIKPDGASFIDVPLELMPMVLAWLQNAPRNGYQIATSFMFDALRSYWDLPSLFVGRHQPEEVKMCLRDMVSTVSNEEVVCGQSFHQALLPPRKPSEYDTVLPMTSRGLLLNIGEIPCDVGLGNDLTHTAFLGYRSLPDGSKVVPEISTLVKEHGDVITAVNGISTIDKSFKEFIPLIKNVMNLPFLHMRLQSRRSFLQPILDSAQPEYDTCHIKSTSIQLELRDIREEYRALVESQKQEVELGSSNSNIERLQRSHTRAQNDLKNRLQKINERFAAAEYNRGKAWRLLTKVRPRGCRCGHTCCCARNYCQKAKKRRLD